MVAGFAEWAEWAEDISSATRPPGPLAYSFGPVTPVCFWYFPFLSA